MTKEQAQQHLEAWLAADLALAAGKEYKLGSRSLTRANAAEVKERISYWQRVVNSLSGKNRFRRVIPIE